MTDHLYYGAHEGWIAPCVGDLVEICSKSSLKTSTGVVVEPSEEIKSDSTWCRIVLNDGEVKVLPKKDVTVIQRGGEAQLCFECYPEAVWGYSAQANFSLWTDTGRRVSYEALQLVFI